MVQFHLRSLNEIWSVSVSGARVLGKDEGRVQFPDGPFNRLRSRVASERRAKQFKKNGLACSLGATDFCKVGVLGSIPIRSTEMNGLMVQRDDASSAGWRSGFNSRWVHCYGR